MQSFHHNILITYRQVLTSVSNSAQPKLSLTSIQQCKKFQVPFPVTQLTICVRMSMYSIEASHQICTSSHAFLRSRVESYLFSLYLRKEIMRCLRFAERVITQCIKSACVGENTVTTKYTMQNNLPIWLIPIQNRKRVGRFISFYYSALLKQVRREGDKG